MSEPLPPLPLVHGELLLDNSFIEGFTTCARSSEYNRIRNRVSVGENNALNFGSAIHLALDYRYSNYGNLPIDILGEEAQFKILLDFFTEHPPTVDSHRHLGFAMECIRHYNMRYQEEPWQILADQNNKPMVEYPFICDLYTTIHPLTKEPLRVKYIGKIDLVTQRGNHVMPMDTKTTSLLGDTFFLDKFSSSQLPGYCWALEQTTNLKTTGYAINGIRTKSPPKSLASGSEKDIRNWWFEGFARDQQYLHQNQLAEWKTNTIELIERFLWHYSRNYFPQEKSWCFGKYGRCQYHSTCILPSESRLLDLETTNYKEQTWSPLNKPKQK